MKKEILLLVLCLLIVIENVVAEGNGVFKDSETGQLVNEQTSGDLSLSGEEVYGLDKNYLTNDANRDSATNEQINEFDKKRLKEEFGVDVNGDTFDGKWSDDGKSFEYEGTKLNRENIKGAKSVEFMDEGFVKIGFEGGNILVKNNEVVGRIPVEVITPKQPLQSPGVQQPALPGGSSSGGSGGGEGGQDPGALLQQGMQIAQQIAGALEGLKGSVGSNGKGSTQATALSGGGAEFVLNNGAEIYAEDDEDNQVKLAQTDENSEAVVKVEDGLDKIDAESNVEATVYNQVTVSTTPETPPTEILLAGISGDSPQQEAEALSLNQEYYGVSGAVVSDLSGGQFVKLIEHSLSLSGEKIIVDLFKSFNSIEGDGDELLVRDGDISIKFHGMKVYYSRKIGDVSKSIGKISNSQDKDRVFSLIEYKDNKARLLDSNARVSIGDMSIEHPRDSGLIIARVRKDMWVDR